MRNAFARATDRVLGREGADHAAIARIDQTLEAVQAGSFCKTAPVAPSPPRPDLKALLQANLKPKAGG
jgi:hypothetical protein